MKNAIRLGLLVLFAAAAAGPAAGGELKVTVAAGRVTIAASDVTPRQILGEWARVGQIKVTNLERSDNPSPP